MNHYWNKHKGFSELDLINVDISNKDKCIKFYRKLNDCGLFADQVCALRASINDIDFFKNQLSVQFTPQDYDNFNGTTLGNLGLVIATCNDLYLKQKAFNIIKNFQMHIKKNSLFDYSELFKFLLVLIFIIVIIIYKW